MAVPTASPARLMLMCSGRLDEGPAATLARFSSPGVGDWIPALAFSSARAAPATSNKAQSDSLPEIETHGRSIARQMPPPLLILIFYYTLDLLPMTDLCRPDDQCQYGTGPLDSQPKSEPAERVSSTSSATWTACPRPVAAALAR